MAWNWNTVLLLGLGDWKEVNSHYSGHNGGSNPGRGVIRISGHILLYTCLDAILGQAQDIWYAAAWGGTLTLLSFLIHVIDIYHIGHHSEKFRLVLVWFIGQPSGKSSEGLPPTSSPFLSISVSVSYTQFVYHKLKKYVGKNISLPRLLGPHSSLS